MWQVKGVTIVNTRLTSHSGVKSGNRIQVPRGGADSGVDVRTKGSVK